MYCFCFYSFQNPVLYHKIFFEEFGNNLNVALREYYAIFPDELTPDEDIDLKNMLLQYNIYDRTAQSLEKCVKDGYLNQNDIDKVSELSLLIYEGMLDRIISKMWKGTLEEATERTIYYIFQILATISKHHSLSGHIIHHTALIKIYWIYPRYTYRKYIWQFLFSS